MADKVDNMMWLDLVEKFKLKDNGLKKPLRDYAEAKARDECDVALKALADIAKLGTDLKNSKEAKAAGPDVVKRLGKLLDGVATAQKEWQQKKTEKAKAGCQLDIQIILEGWDGKDMYPGTAKVEISSVGGETIRKEIGIPGTLLKINDVFLQPKGALALAVYQSNKLVCKGTADFKFSPGKDKGMQFRFSQASQLVKETAKELGSLSEKLGLEGEASVEIKVLKVGGKVTKESEYMQGYEKEVMWEVEIGAEKFKEAKQVA